MSAVAAVVDFEALVRITEDRFPKAAKHLLGPGTHYRLVEAQVAAEAVVLVAETVAVAEAVAAEVVDHPVAEDAQSGTGCCTE
jgi:hypothetical protein